MRPEERLSVLVELMENGSAQTFAKKCGIPTACLSRARNGKGNPSAYYERILKAYPEVRREWLYEDRGEPTKERATKSRLEAKIDALTKEVKRLSELVESFKKVSI